ncbi:hypothetical protein [Saccharopolyspora shandongensis]|uniref:hypothetical protein n=1 Tax=Saccharopolyspora shandongensis TaxID=418495 RepID=UPI0033ECBECD
MRRADETTVAAAALDGRAPLSPQAILALQRTVGNAAVARLLGGHEPQPNLVP